MPATRVALLALVAMAALLVAALAHRFTAPPGTSPKVLPIEHVRQERLLCVPTAAAMVTRYYGDPRSPRELKVLASGGDYVEGMGFQDFSITLYRDLVRGVRRLGYDWSERTYANTPEGFARGIAEIERELSGGRPVLVDLSLSVGHTVVVRGFDPNRRLLFIVDPDHQAPGERTLSYDQFSAVWNETYYGNDFRSAILTGPRSPS